MERHDSVVEEPDKIVALAAKPENKVAYITLLTRASYLAGVVLLAHTLRKQGSRHPLIVLYTPTLTKTALHALELEAIESNMIICSCELLVPPEHHKLNVAVERFTDTWTKLRVFQYYDEGYATLCYLDADMILLQNMDIIFNHANQLSKDCIAAVHDCVCSPDKMPWTPEDHCKENCPLTPQTHPQAITDPMPISPNTRATYHLFNSGMFLFHPHKTLWDDIFHFFNTTDLLGTFHFPDQDFMAHFFHNRWMAVSWQYNAVKTMAYRHQNIWRREDIICLHLIVDKPWAKRVGPNGIAGFKGQDGATHRMWWDEYDSWCELRHSQGSFEVASLVNKHVAQRESEASDAKRSNMMVIGNDVSNLSNIVEYKRKAENDKGP